MLWNCSIKISKTANIIKYSMATPPFRGKSEPPTVFWYNTNSNAIIEQKRTIYNIFMSTEKSALVFIYFINSKIGSQSLKVCPTTAVS